MYQEVEAYIKLSTNWSSYRCLHPEVYNFHEESIQFVYKMVSRNSWVQFNSDTLEKKENSNADTLSRSSHMPEARPLADDKYAKFYETNLWSSL